MRYGRQADGASAAYTRARVAIMPLLASIVLAGFAPQLARAQAATAVAGAIKQQGDAAADSVAHVRADAAAAIGQGASDAAGAVAQQASSAAASLAQQSADAAAATVPRAPAPLKPNPEFADFPRYAGTLGSRRIILRLGNKTDDPSGVHGEYQFADTGAVVLVAGDREGDVLEIEESNDGTTITGNWVGRFSADGRLAGDRMNVDDSDPQPFDLRPLTGPSSTP